MAGDYSRKIFTREKHYSGVLMQQGRVQLDSDWNEQLDIQQYRTGTQTIDVVGVAGAPKASAGFQIGVSAAGSQLTISPGRLYAGGLLCELDQPATYFRQPHYPAPDPAYFSASPAGSPAGPPDSDLRPLLSGTYLVYLDAWQRELNFRDDPQIHEVALGEADTTTRLQTVWQVKLMRVATEGASPVTCSSAIKEWISLQKPATGKLQVQTKRTADPKDPCLLPPTTGFRRLENQLYRIEVQKSGTRETATFKWSRDNASVETIIESIVATDVSSEKMTVRVADLGRDAVLGFALNQWIEVVDEHSTLTSQPRDLVRIVELDPGTRQLTLEGPIVSTESSARLKLRRWDQKERELPLQPPEAGGGWREVEDGIEVSFTEGTYHAGDYWMVAARTATGDVEWPQAAAPAAGPEARLPAGTAHHYCQLALVEIQQGLHKLQDCRRLFPPLTEITAADVGFNNAKCSFDPAVETVQQALDALCQQRRGSCTLTAIPGEGWESVFDKIGPNQDADLCFPVGDYVLRDSAKISGKGNLKLTGSGPGTRLLGSNLEAALVFENCRSVLIRDLYAESTLPGKPVPVVSPRLNGVFTFLGCPAVAVENATLNCGAAPARAACCLTVRNTEDKPGAVRICNCILQVGNQQQGILLVNMTTALVEHNTLGVYQASAPLSIKDVLAEPLLQAALRRRLISTLPNGPAGPSNPSPVLPSSSFTKAGRLRTAWQTLLRTHPLGEGADPQAEARHLRKMAQRLLVDEEFRRSFPPLEQEITAIIQHSRPVGTQGITLGGRIARDVRVLNNTIEGSLQGVHVGLSHASAATAAADRADTVTIAGNTIGIVLSPLALAQDRHGIFVGNCNSLLIENNNIRLVRLPGTRLFPIDGIRVWGNLGDRLMITKNYVASADGQRKHSFSNGIVVQPEPRVNKRPSTAQWVVMWNVAPSIDATVRANSGVVNRRENTPL
ncbi:DUF6519 domain-containing protein [Hymenobacter sp. HD11105]